VRDVSLHLECEKWECVGGDKQKQTGQSERERPIEAVPNPPIDNTSAARAAGCAARWNVTDTAWKIACMAEGEPARRNGQIRAAWRGGVESEQSRSSAPTRLWAFLYHVSGQ
jgi:hypothetical protein